jgi:transposase-like protein
MPRPRRSREQWFELISAWRASGSSGVDFAREHGLNPNTFAWWRSELSRTGRSMPLTLVPITAVSASVSTEPLEVVLPGDIRIRVPESTDPTWVARLIQALEAR